ncbi:MULTISPECIES: helix-turn-helix domain-containing protein [Vibrio harveyi group]|jgi:hypothetical protein|nr:helix-turn-helix domain-containing protein [Vibrio parahaemolyticus]ECX6397710.1 helix-turn-helix domain-containing protein [Salmonella enterica subsp. enterica serovar Newport]EDR5806086.1 helix-turn-helix domain-containing protein [Salmonella enterica subsp. enterica serovar Saintpaul]EGQ9576174.1 helix-turn-helix domain-containing protein [Vibrio alginolyticus]ECX6406703.1 helix-turn-helix domain-containing protein [Salmonella enterica subsp. enterica serovar Newport]EGQ9765824.1 helix-t
MAQQRTQFDLMHPLFQTMKEHKLPTTQRMLLLGLFRFMDGHGVCYPSYRALMDETGLSRQAIATNLKKLVAAGWLEYETGDKSLSQANTYYLNLEKLGFTVDNTVVPLPSRSKYIAVDGSEWDCAADYWKHRQQH